MRKRLRRFRWHCREPTRDSAIRYLFGSSFVRRVPHHDRTDELAIFDTVGDIQASVKVFSLVTPLIRHEWALVLPAVPHGINGDTMMAWR